MRKVFLLAVTMAVAGAASGSLVAQSQAARPAYRSRTLALRMTTARFPPAKRNFTNMGGKDMRRAGNSGRTPTATWRSRES